MKIQLKSISLTNFKGIKSFACDFEDVTSISGENATGKTTIFDAFNFLFFGKDSHDRKDFEVKTLKPDGTPFHNLDHEVSACILIDGQERYFKRVLKEDWVKKRGEETPELKGHTTYFWINNAPYQAGEYKKQVDEVLPEGILKLLSSPTYFCNLPWKEQRVILTKIAGDIPQPEGFDTLLSELKEKGIGIDKYKQEISGKKKLLKDELILIPARIDEATRSMTEKVDVKKVNEDIAGVEKEIEKINAQIQDIGKLYNDRNHGNIEKQNKINALKVRLVDIEATYMTLNRNIANERNQKITELEQFQQQFSNKQAEDIITQTDTQIAILNSTITKLREEWGAENSKGIVFDDNDLNCPACKRPLDDIESKKEELTTSFNSIKSDNLERINKRGQGLKLELKNLEDGLINIKSKKDRISIQFAEISTELEALKSKAIEKQDYTTDEEYRKIGKEITGIVIEQVTPQDTADLTTVRQSFHIELDQLRKQLVLHDNNLKASKRIDELGLREKELSQLIADLEKSIFQIEEYERVFINNVESRVNSMFTLCKIKMFKTLINGGTEETCDILVDGVPYAGNLNSAAKILVGLDIIRTLGNFYNTSVPVFIDNAEGIVNIPKMDFQIIKLVVDGSFKKLTISYN